MKNKSSHVPARKPSVSKSAVLNSTTPIEPIDRRVNVMGVQLSKRCHTLPSAVCESQTASLQRYHRPSGGLTARVNRDNISNTHGDQLVTDPVLVDDVCINSTQDDGQAMIVIPNGSNKGRAAYQERSQQQESPRNGLKSRNICLDLPLQDVRKVIEFERDGDPTHSDVSTTASIVPETPAAMPPRVVAEDWSVLISGQELYQNASKALQLLKKPVKGASERGTDTNKSSPTLGIPLDLRKNVEANNHCLVKIVEPNNQCHDANDAELSRKLYKILRSHLSTRKDHNIKIVASAQSQGHNVVREFRRASAARHGKLMAIASGLRSKQIAKMRKACQGDGVERIRHGRDIAALLIERKNVLSQVYQVQQELTVMLSKFEDNTKCITSECRKSLERTKCNANSRIQKVSKADTLMTGISNLLGTMM
jgi:hypothetical protein